MNADLHPLDVQTITALLRPVFCRHRIAKAILFGSYARGEPSRRSDIDLIIIQQTQKRFMERYDGFLRELTAAVPGTYVEPLIYTPEELERIASRPFIAKILREGKVIYESEESAG